LAAISKTRRDRQEESVAGGIDHEFRATSADPVGERVFDPEQRRKLGSSRPTHDAGGLITGEAAGNRKSLGLVSTATNQTEELVMDKDRIAGGVKKVTGKIKEEAGKALGDRQTEAEGKADQSEGRVQGAVGHIKDAAREITGKK
jgi:uncharacterized protein YjbJ (UPF0337 family)